MTPAGTSGTWKRRLSAIDAPTISATSVDMQISSAWSQSPTDTARGYRSRQASARLRCETTPSLAERYWMTMAMRLAASTTQSSR